MWTVTLPCPVSLMKVGAITSERSKKSRRFDKCKQWLLVTAATEAKKQLFIVQDIIS